MKKLWQAEPGVAKHGENQQLGASLAHWGGQGFPLARQLVLKLRGGAAQGVRGGVRTSEL